MAKSQPVPPIQPAPKFKAAQIKTAAVVGKPATQLLWHPRPPWPTVKFLAISRAPSPYDELVNVDTLLEGTIDLAGNVHWTPIAQAHTNSFTVTNNGTQQFFHEKFVLKTNL